ncbi:MAG TPA: rRNA maturation RNase YbeY [Bacteroidales bacterium]|nr:rRNA maturation RNase YbeY [Bacteroidales bacterium]HNS45958.1 rRNA maturation RNase YbeY [Bacteroidales bacterium]
MTDNRIHFFLEGVSYPLRNKEKLRQWLDMVIISENESYHDINIILCTDEFLRQLNLTYLSHDHFTDVLTFDFSESEQIASGDIYISLPRVKENAITFGVSVKDELHRVMVHGILHLAGYDDKRARDKKRMTEKENHYLSLREKGI